MATLMRRTEVVTCGADLEQFESDGTDGGAGQAGGLQRSAAQALHQHIGERGHQEPELIGAEGAGGGAIGGTGRVAVP